MYLHEQADWPNFTWDSQAIALQLAELRHQQGKLLGRMESLGFNLREEASLQALTNDVVKSSLIEGEELNSDDVRSSIARRLGIELGVTTHASRDVEGIVEIILDATSQYESDLTKERLCDWHAALFPTGRNGMQRIIVGDWRNELSESMEVVSGPFGKEKVHYRAPDAERLESEMEQFLVWFNGTSPIDLVLKSAIAHFWFVSIHPFDDGNGRIARAIADMALAQSEKSSQRFYSMSSQIQKERNDYYDILESSQKASLDITKWIQWYLGCLERSIHASEQLLGTILHKAEFWKKHAQDSFNDRQCKIINRLLDGFEGKLTSSKWAKITKCSQDTALRDVTNLIERDILVKDDAGGRSTSYSLVKIGSK